MSWARPTLRRNVDFPPELAPVMMTSDFRPACTSLPTTMPSDRSARQASRRSAHENVSGDGGAGSGNEIDPSAGEVGQDLAPGLVAGRQGEGIGRARADPQPFLPPALRVRGGAEHEVDPAVVP